MAQDRTADKSSEITAIPELLEALDIKGSIITIDVMGYQHEITKTKLGIANKRLKARWNMDYLAKLFGLAV